MPEKFLHGHLAFRRGVGSERTYLRRLAREGQKPKVLFIGCSDSRVIPELLTGATAGELFVVRNIANHVPALENVDSSVGAAIDYAVSVLGVEDVVVCGHTGCGGVRAAMDGVEKIPEALGSLRDWVSNIVPAIQGVDTQEPRDATHTFKQAVEENVLTSLDNLTTYPSIANRLADGTIGLHAWLYDIERIALQVYDADTSEWLDAKAVVSTP
jgi:carbonic anhydrase